MDSQTRAGLVLAGGFSTRFSGGDKTMATLVDRPLIAHAITGLAPAVERIFVSCREAQLPNFESVFASVSIEVTPVTDPVPNRGPAAALAHVLGVVEEPMVAVVAADMPFVDAAFFEELFDLAEGTDGAVPMVDGHRQSTHGVYRTGPFRDAAHAAADGDGSLQAVLGRLNLTEMSEDTVRSLTTLRTFYDVNTVEDLQEVREFLDPGPETGD